MKTNAKKLLSVLLCAVFAFGAALPVLAAVQTRTVEPTWQNTIESVTPVGDAPYVKIRLSAEGYKIEECRLPQRYDVVFKDGTSVSAQISAEPSHFAPLVVYENYFDVETPEGPITLYAKVMFSGTGTKELVFSVGQYLLDGSLGDDGVPIAGSMVYEFPILEEPCEPEVDEGGLFTRILYFFYSAYQKVRDWIVYHLGR